MAHAECGLAAPLIRNAENPTVLWFTHADLNMYTSLARYRGTGEHDRGQYPTTIEIGHTPTCWMLRREDFERLGGHDERLGMYFEESDIAHRVRRELGKRVFLVTGASLFHDIPLQTIEKPFFRSERRRYLQERNRVIFMRKHASPLQRVTFFLFLPAIVLYYGAFHGTRRQWNLFGLVLKGVWDGTRFDLRQPPAPRPSFAVGPRPREVIRTDAAAGVATA